MNYFIGTISHGSTGIKTVTVGFQPKSLRITVGSQFGNVDTIEHKSEGFTDGTAQYYHSIFSDGTGRQTISGNDRIVSHFDRVGGVLTEVLRANISSFNATQVKYNIITANANYQLFIEVLG